MEREAEKIVMLRIVNLADLKQHTELTQPRPWLLTVAQALSDDGVGFVVELRKRQSSENASEFGDVLSCSSACMRVFLAKPSHA